MSKLIAYISFKPILKMKKYIPLFTTLFLAMMVSCKQDKKIGESAEADQMKMVMAIHDEVMPKMSEIGSLANQLKKRIDSNEGGASEEKAIENLKEAHKSMMDWMQSFGDRFDSDEIMDGKELSPTKKEWLNEEEEKVKIVKEKINSSIANAKALLGE